MLASGASGLRLPGDRGPPHLASASPFLCSAELSATSSSSCSGELRIALGGPLLPSTGPRPLSPLRFQCEGTWSQRPLATKSATHDKLSFIQGRLGRVHSPKSHRIILRRLERWRTACQLLLFCDIEEANATLRGVCSSHVSQHMWCGPGATFTVPARAQSGPWSVHVPVAFSTLPCHRSIRSTGKQQTSPGRMGFHSPLHRYFLQG